MGTMGLYFLAHGGGVSDLLSLDNVSAGGWTTVDGKLRSA